MKPTRKEHLVLKETREIFEAMKEGNDDAFDSFFERQAPGTLVYINYRLGRRLRRKIDPADILQNLYLKVYSKFESFRGRVERLGIRQALVRMADHEITEAYRYHFKVDKRNAMREVTAEFLRAGNETTPDAIQWVPSDATSVAARVIRQEEYRRAMRMLGLLSPIEQFVTVARVIEGAPVGEIAERAGKSRGAIQMLLRRVRDKLRERLSDDDSALFPDP